MNRLRALDIMNATAAVKGMTVDSRLIRISDHVFRYFGKRFNIDIAPNGRIIKVSQDKEME